MTNYELRITNSEGEEEPDKNPAARLTPAMERWVRLLGEGYSIKPAIWRSTYRGTVWRPALFNPDGAFVQMVRVDTARRLQAMGYLK